MARGELKEIGRRLVFEYDEKGKHMVAFFVMYEESKI